MKPILEIRNISKQYVIGGKKKRYLSLRESLPERVKNIIGKPKSEQFWALNDINFDVYPGDTIGIIGKNGAGKSTLLKIISRITPPTKGYIKARGRIASLLEVGTGFHPELTGQENIFLNGSILGLKRKEIQTKFDEIVEFSGVEQFLETPLKHYSSGMQLRLAFSVAAHLEPEILVVDEVLAVGDAEFQKKCLGKMEEVSRSEGRTVLFVSHNLGAVLNLCQKGVYLKNGQVHSLGKTQEIIDIYLKSLKTAVPLNNITFNGPLQKKITLKKILINNVDPFSYPVHISQLVEIEISLFFSLKKIKPFRITLSIFKDGIRLFSLHDSKSKTAGPGDINSLFILTKKVLRPGLYSIAVGGHETNEFGDWFWREDLCTFEITEEWDEDIEPINLGLINVKAKTERIIL